MLKRIKNLIKQFYFKRGINLNQKYVVFESDDWGSIRSSKQGLEYLKENYPEKKLDSYQKNDALETIEDLEELFKILKKHKDHNGNHPIFTANYIMQNVKQLDENNNTLIYEDFYNSYLEKDTIKYINDATANKLWFPQLHGLLHFNNTQLLEECGNNELVRNCLKNKMIGVGGGNFQGMDAFASRDNVEENLDKAFKIFEKVFGYKSLSYIFPCYTWSKKDEKFLKDQDVKAIQSGLFQFEKKNKKTKIRMHYMGQKNKYNQRYFIRNCQFEPSKYNRDENSLQICKNKCLAEIDNAFKNKKPAIICSHRCNFIGSIDIENREKNLQLLDELLEDILKKYPDVEFTTTANIVEKLV